MAEPITDRFLRRAEVEKIVGMRRSALYHYMSRGEFPRPLRIGANAVRWSLAEIRQWQATRPRSDGDRDRVRSTNERQAQM